MEKQKAMRESVTLQRGQAYINAAPQVQNGALVRVERNGSIVAWRSGNADVR